MSAEALTPFNGPYNFLTFAHYNDPPPQSRPKPRLSRHPDRTGSKPRPPNKSHQPHPLTTFSMAASSQEEMEVFQRLSDQYQPEIEGPLVAEKRPMSVLVQEYAQADRAYIAKTVSLSSTHSAYRSIKGDGQCGWRAAVFGYFETLLTLGDAELIEQEIIRIKSFEDTMRMAGIDYEIVVDLFDFTWELFEKVKQAAQTGSKDEHILMAAFNEETPSNYILYHFRASILTYLQAIADRRKLMTSAYMALRPQEYEEFLEMPLSDYRATRLDPPNQEIDQIGLQGLVHAVIAPAGMGLEVSYLDRSEGDVVTPYQFVPNGEQLPNIRLLYRPGHYDMIYKSTQPIRVLHAQLPQQVLSPTSYQSPPLDPSSYMVPSSIMVQQSSASNHKNRHSEEPQNFDYRDGSFQGMFYPVFANNTYTMNGSTTGPEDSSWSPAPPGVTLSPRHITTTPSPTNPLPARVPVDPASSSPQEDRFRMTSVYYDYGRRRQLSIPLETGPLRDDPENRGHYLSADFQPVIWTPDEYDGKS